MKILIISLMLMTMGFAQSEFLFTDYDYGINLSDSLTPTSPYKTLSLNYRYDWLTLAIRDTGATYDDSIKVEYSDPATGLWYPIHFLKDSTFTSVTQPIVDDNSRHSYLMFVEPYQKIRIYRTNVQVVANRMTYIRITASKKKIVY